MKEKPKIVRHSALVTRKMRNVSNGHKSVIVWFTGLSGSGKSTLAHKVEDKLHSLSCKTFVLDGDNVRHGLSVDLGFNDNDRKESVRRIGEVAKLMLEAGIIVMVAVISPFAEDRDAVRKSLEDGDFIEVYCKASLEVCESRDVKGMYKQARSGEIKNYTGIDSPYEEPLNPELIMDTGKYSVEELSSKVVSFLIDRGIVFVEDLKGD